MPLLRHLVAKMLSSRLRLVALCVACGAFSPSPRSRSRRAVERTHKDCASTIARISIGSEKEEEGVLYKRPSSGESIAAPVTELSDSFEDAVGDAVLATVAAIDAGRPRLRVDFDTAMGDNTYTTLKNTMPFAQLYVAGLADELAPDAAAAAAAGELDAAADAAARWVEVAAEVAEREEGSAAPFASVYYWNQESGETTWDAPRAGTIVALDGTSRDAGAARAARAARAAPGEGAAAKRTVAIWFPDAGAAALAKSEWKVGTDEAQVPESVRFCSFPRSQVEPTDAAVVVMCQKASETPLAEKLVNGTFEVSPDSAVIFINPEFVDMGVTGFGLQARLVQQRTVDMLEQAYYLKAWPWGAVARCWPRAIGVWQEDADAADGSGYKLLAKLAEIPGSTETEQIYDVANGYAEKPEEPGVVKVLGGLADFINEFSKM